MAESATKSFEITPPGSRLIAALSADDQNFFYSKSQKINLTMGQILCEPGDPLEFVYFPTCGVISIIALMRSGGGV